MWTQSEVGKSTKLCTERLFFGQLQNHFGSVQNNFGPTERPVFIIEGMKGFVFGSWWKSKTTISFLGQGGQK